jgi:hypothetical protein
MEDNRSYSGMFLNWPLKTVDKDDLLRCPNLRFNGVVNKTRWEQYEFRSAEPLLGEEISDQTPYVNYPIICRRGGHRLVLLSVAQKVIEHIRQEELNRIFIPHIREVKIDVDKLVRDLTTRPTIYVLGYVHAKLGVFGALLRSASFYGDDLAEASLFKDHLEIMSFSTCGLRSAIGSNEIVRLNSDGSLYHILPDPNRLIEVEKVLSFLYQSGYLLADEL